MHGFDTNFINNKFVSLFLYKLLFEILSFVLFCISVAILHAFDVKQELFVLDPFPPVV